MFCSVFFHCNILNTTAFVIDEILHKASSLKCYLLHDMDLLSVESLEFHSHILPTEMKHCSALVTPRDSRSPYSRLTGFVFFCSKQLNLST